MSIQNQDPGITHLVVLNNEEITEHGRVFQASVVTASSDIELANGNKRRFIKNAKNTYTLSYTWIPNIPEHTVDGRKARDFLYSVATTSAAIPFSVKTDPAEPFYNTYVYVESYNETLVRRDIASKCSYYNLDISLKEK
jgi:hypothetical protein